MTGPRQMPTRDDLLAARCWCGRSPVRLTPHQVLNGRTEACGPLCEYRYRIGDIDLSTPDLQRRKTR